MGVGLQPRQGAAPSPSTECQEAKPGVGGKPPAPASKAKNEGITPSWQPDFVLSSPIQDPAYVFAMEEYKKEAVGYLRTASPEDDRYED